jgi:hypothetical protein
MEKKDKTDLLPDWEPTEPLPDVMREWCRRNVVAALKELVLSNVSCGLIEGGGRLLVTVTFLNWETLDAEGRHDLASFEFPFDDVADGYPDLPELLADDLEKTAARLRKQAREQNGE